MWSNEAPDHSKPIIYMEFRENLSEKLRENSENSRKLKRCNTDCKSTSVVQHGIRRVSRTFWVDIRSLSTWNIKKTHPKNSENSRRLNKTQENSRCRITLVCWCRFTPVVQHVIRRGSRAFKTHNLYVISRKPIRKTQGNSENSGKLKKTQDFLSFP